MKLIDKDALVAEIEKRIESCAKQREDMLNVQCHALADDASARMGELNCIQDFLDTLEVKEVDLDLEITLWANLIPEIQLDDVERLAKHFFKLGLCSTITEEDCKLIWNIGDNLPYMPEEDFFKELLRRYKAQKGE